ncbi:MAG TPA: redoxin domain-containing protein [Bacillota bacterium]|nr:redoxin domain-containing protein [Bacillota bacterium]
MRKALVVIVIVGMFAWAVYDFAIKSDESADSDRDYTVEEGVSTAADSTGEDDGDTTEKVGLEIGNVAPDFELNTLEGETVNLSDYRGEKVMLNFWATWCPPCRAEVPDMQRFFEDKDVTILAVNLTSTESSEKVVTDFVEDYGMTFDVLLDENTQVASQYQIQPIPTSFLINSDGTIHNKAFGALNYEMMIQEYEKMH